MGISAEQINKIQKSKKDALLRINSKGHIDLMNEKACELLELDFYTSLYKHINSVLPESELTRIFDTGIPEIHQDLVYKNKKLIVTRIPILDNEVVTGVLAIFYDNTEVTNLSKRLYEDEVYIDILNTILDTFNERVVVVDENSNIIMMSKSYKDFLGVEHPEGRHVTEVIENTRMHIVVDNKEMEVGDIQQIKDSRMIAMRIPIKKEGKVIGAVGKIMFKDISDLAALSNKVNKLEKEIEFYKSELDNKRVAKYSFKNIIGDSKKMVEVKTIATKASRTDSNVLIMGESGTGKELFASAIHNSSKRVGLPFIKVNCAAIPAELLESELFGYEEGAFTGAKKSGKKGKFEIANGGTILLDEIGDMPFTMQAKLLRVLQEKEIERLGGNSLKEIDVRIIASTNKDLESLVKKGEFREDLFYRLNVMVINPPPLRERKDDIHVLAEVLKKKIAKNLGVYVEGISKEAMQYLLAYDWPGNIRELENVIERAINLLDSDLTIKPQHLPIRLTKCKTRNYTMSDDGLKGILDEVEKEVIKEYLIKTNGNKNKTSKLLGISRVSLYKKIDKYHLENIKNS